MIHVSIVAETAEERARVRSLLASRAEVMVVDSDVTSAQVTVDARFSGSGRGVRSPAVLLVDARSAVPFDQLMDGPVHAILPREASSDELVVAVQAVALGLLVIDESLLSRDGAARRGRASVDSEEPRGPLTARERDVLDLIASGLGTKQIAGRLSLSVHTIKTHVESIFLKLGVRSRAEAVAIGARDGLVEL
jgi:two-component system, NarL family, response regulator YdfI